MEEKQEEKKQRKRNGKSRRPKHHPWDEVSLPGAGTSPTEQQTILQVLNNKHLQPQATEVASAEAESESSATAGSSAEAEDTSTADKSIREVETLESADTNDDLVNSHSPTNTENSFSNESATSQIPISTVTSGTLKSAITTEAEAEETATAVANPSTSTVPASDTEPTKETISPPAVDRQSSNSGSADQGHVLDFESHLIETYNEYQTPDDSVGINELQPQQNELTVGTSKVETHSNVRTVIEVEPAGAISKKPIEIVVQTSQSQRIESGIEDADSIKVEPDIEVKAWDRVEKGTETETETGVEQEAAVIKEQWVPSDAIKATAERLVNEIEREVLEALKRCEEAKQELKAEPEAETEKATEIEEETAQILSNKVVSEQDQKEEKTEQTASLLDEISNTLSQKVDAQLSEVTSILKSSKPSNGEALKADADQTKHNELKIVNVPSPKTPSDEHERQLFLESLPHINSNAEAQKLVDDCKREYYQSLKKYLIQSPTDRPPVPLQTYKWEDLRRAKERGGYPWTHLYKRPLGPDEEPEIVLLLRKSQEFRFVSESPKSLKKVRIDEQVVVKQPERYIQELSEGEEDYLQSAPEDEETHSLRSESISCVSDSVLATGKPRKSTRLEKIRGYLRRRKGGRTNEDAQSLPCASTSSSRRHSQENLASPNPQILINGKNTEQKHCYPIMKKLKSMADRQKKRLNIRRIHLGKDEKIVLGEETKILKLKKSPKAERGEIPHFIEKQDSDDVLEIMELDESPSRKRRDDNRQEDENSLKDSKVHLETNHSEGVDIVVPDEIIEIPDLPENNKDTPTTIDAAIVNEAETPTEASEDTTISNVIANTVPSPKKAPRLRREHVYEEIESEIQPESLTQPTVTDSGILEPGAVEALKESLAKQNSSTLKHIEDGVKSLPLDRMGSSEEEQIAAASAAGTSATDKPTMNLLAPLSSIDSASSDEDRNRAQLSPVTEESDATSIIEDNLRIVEDHEPIDLKPAIKKEASPAPSDKKVTFSHVEDEAEPHREDIELPMEVQEATQEAALRKKWTNMR